MASEKTPIRIALLLEEIQLSDIIGIDILGNLSTPFVSRVASLSPAHAQFIPHSLPLEFLYVSSSLSPTTTTPSLRYLPTHTYDTCPRDVDIVIIGGGFLDFRPEAARRFIREAWRAVRTWMTVCTGGLWLADSGILKGEGEGEGPGGRNGRKVKMTTNRMGLELARGLYPEVEWVDKRWVVDGKEWEGEREGKGKGEVWSAGGAGCGIDMIATWALQNFDEKFVRVMALDSLEFDPERKGKGQEYEDEEYRYQEFVPRLPGKTEG